MKIFTKIIHFIMVILALLVQVTLAEQLKFYSIDLDLLMICIISVAVVDGYYYGIIYGFVFGLLLDFMAGNIVGINALIYGLNAFLAARLVEMGIKRRFPVLLLIVFFITEVNLVMEAMLHYLFNYGLDIVQLGKEMIIKPVYSILLLLLIFPLFNLGQKKRWIFGFKSKEEA
ncbi:MAG: rod shape-determining protein MreD [Actinomycetota bacterium]|nr:rod shape-determining protein MreD [Actinomycetota bacterium]